MPSTSTDTCPLCSNDEHEDWIQCAPCKQWYHTFCLNIPKFDISSIVSFHCPKCVPKHGSSTYKRKSKRSKVSVDYQALNEGDMFAVDKNNHFHLGHFLKFEGKPDISIIDVFTKSEKPILIPQADLKKHGMKFPILKEKIDIDYITDVCGEDTGLEVMDVISQQSVSPAWNLKKWQTYFNTEEEKRDRIRNVISLEVSDTTLGKGFKRPDCVEEMDLVDKVWDKQDPNKRSKVTKYCLMSVKNSFTDFHIDFGGTSVYYTICRGAKSFLMFPPTDDNLEIYTQWCNDSHQNFKWYPDYEITKNKKKLKPINGFKVTLQPGDLFIIPSGWIHAVHTPQDSIVIGGNYITIRDMKMQLKINDIEKITKVPTKFRFPMFNKVLWLSAWYYYNHQDEFMEDIGESEDDGYEILDKLIIHLQGHLELSKTNVTAKKSIPNSVGNKPQLFLDKLSAWKETLR
ncbi:JHD1 JmjC domain-containing histone demethylation protein 1 [Candida maltosa Xu316]